MTDASPTPQPPSFDLRAAIVGPLSAFPGGTVPDASDWLFVTGHGRTGGMALARMLNEHPDVQITIEDGTVQLLAVALTSELFQIESPHGPTCKAAHGHYTLPQLRDLCEAWRQIKCPGAKIVGDKLYMLWNMRDQLRKLFPGCLIAYTYRHPLDQLASYIALGATWLKPDGSADRAQLAAQFILDQVEQVKIAQSMYRVAAIPFEALTRQRSRIALVDHLWHLAGAGADASALARVGGTGYDAPDGSVGRSVGRYLRDRVVTTHLQNWRTMGLFDRLEQAATSLGYSLEEGG